MHYYRFYIGQSSKTAPDQWGLAGDKATDAILEFEPVDFRISLSDLNQQVNLNRNEAAT
ncbi:hypothetical protein [Pantanalinema sp. GBBB05]|uniref:hypothetical protein n=1 Tax=Pantanalinema sp. GBBB05 TaxID=2604139 RepID=UPI003D813C3F